MKNLFIIFLSLLITNILSGQTMNIHIVPTPKLIKSLDGDFLLKDNLKISVSNSTNENSYSVELIQKTLKDFNSINSSIKSQGDIEIRYIEKEEESHIINNLVDEGYLLRVSKNKIEIKAHTPKGIYYAVMSLIQILEKAQGKLPCIEIIDWPDMKIRGISDDISRGQVSNLENFKKIISHIARYKMNTYMPYLEDMLEFEKYPTIGKDRGALTKNEVKEILDFAKKNFVEVIPIFQTLGHYENILSQEEFLKYAEFPGAASLNVSSDSTYVFLEDLLREVFELFPSEYFHMGADESWDVGLGKSRKLVEGSNIAIVHANHYKKVYNICKNYNKKVMMYGDILLDHPEILSLIPKDIVIVDWHYRSDENYPSTKIIRDASFNYLVSPSVWNFMSTFPANINSLPNIKYTIKAGLENESLGMINSNWGDYGAETFKEFVLYNYAWSAQCSWNYAQSDISKFNQDYFYDYFGIDDARLTNIYTTLSEPLNQIIWHEVWRHPMLNFKEPVWWEPKVSKSARISWNELTLPQVKTDIEILKLKVKKNVDHFDLLEFILRLNDWYKLKLETQFQFQELIKEQSSGDENDLIKMIDENLKSLLMLKKDYQNLWLRYYKESNLNLIDNKFDRLTAYFEEIKESIMAKNLTNYKPLLSSKWIYVQGDDSTFLPKAEFTTSFDLSEAPEEAYLQLMGDSYVQLYINEKFVDKVFARRSLSLLVDHRRIKFINIKSFLVTGTNSVRIIAESFNKKNGAGFNLIASIKSGKKELIVISDDLKSSSSKWLGRDPNNGPWKDVVSKPYPFEVIAPNFSTKRTSWIER
jgi:hexosaminidase